MFTQMHYPQELSGETLDQYLDQGWFRMGQMIFTCQFLCFHGALYTALWTRLELPDFEFRRGQRKLMNKHARRFRIVNRKATFNSEKEKLYQRHKKRFEGYVAGSLKQSLYGESHRDIYDTREFCIYDGPRLVGLSFMDVGDDSTASIMGLFDPDYQESSLGYYSMLLEMEWSKQHGMQFYYPGYVVPGYGRFDYKLRIGPVDYYDIFKKEWFPYAKLDHEELLSATLKMALHNLKTQLADFDVYSEVILYPLYDRDLVGYEGESFIKYPLFLSCYHHKSNHRFLLIEYDFFNKQYRLIRARKYEDSLSYLAYVLFEGYDERTSFLEFLILETILIETRDLSQLLASIHENQEVIRGRTKKR